MLLVVAGAAAQENRPRPGEVPGMRPPQPDMERLRNLIGVWECRGKVFGWPFPGERETAGEFSFMPELNGFWLCARYDERRTAAAPIPFSTVGHWGWDGVRSQYVVGSVDNMGGFTHSWTPGWEGNRMVWTGGFYGWGPTLKLRETFTLDNGTLTHSFEVDKDGWRRVSEETCTKPATAR
jgi:hypothetical protein